LSLIAIVVIVMAKFIDLTGRKFGRLTVIERVVNDKWGNARWLCLCECGREVIIYSGALNNGATQSCGCLHLERIKKSNSTHKKSNTLLYGVWSRMRNRCNNNNNQRYEYYGSRGITICSEWDNFQNFYDWAIKNGYSKNLTIDRIDNDGNYEPSNCRWATWGQQQNNRSDNIYLEYNGNKLSMKEIADIEGVTYKAIASRYYRGKYDLYKEPDKCC